MTIDEQIRRLQEQENAREFLNRPSLRLAKEQAWAREADELLDKILESVA
jgi:hypothetical protein